MKLKNKKTGEITEDIWYEYADENIRIKGETNVYEYNSLAELNEDWEDYEEPKVFWYIEGDGDIHHIRTELCDELEINTMKQIGNYFETKEEAEKAVEKLKAWKRLKDKGFSVYSWDYEFDMVNKPAQTIILKASAIDNSNKDLDLLFGDEK